MRYLFFYVFIHLSSLLHAQPIDTINKAGILDSVIVSTGLQTIAKERATGSFEVVNAATLNQQIGASIISRLNEVTTAVLFDPSKNITNNRKTGINIRGLSTINGAQDPLIILDNFPYEGDLASINPNDIASVSILKDAAASSIWGSRAGNGVIVITSKKGKANQPMQLEFNSHVQVSATPDLYYLSRMHAADYIDVEQFLYQNGFYSWPLTNPSMPALSPALDIFDQTGRGLINSADSAQLINALKSNDVRQQYLNHFYQPAINQQYALNLRGGSPVTQYYVSGGYDKGRDALNALSERITLTTNNTYSPFKNFQLHTGIIYTQSQTTNGKPAYESITVDGKPVPYLRFADAHGEAMPVAQQYRAGYIDTAGAGRLLDWQYYPLTDYQHLSSTTHTQNLLVNIGLSYPLLNGLQADIKYNYQSQKTELQHLADEESYYARSLYNLYSIIDPVSGIVSSAIPYGRILDHTYSSLRSHNIRGQLNYGGQFDDHSIYALAGAEARDIRTDVFGNQVYGYNDEVLTAGIVNGTTPYPTFIDGSQSYIPVGNTIAGTLNRYVSIFGNGSYTYKERYTLSGSVRRDASNLFGLSTNDKWKPFWSGGAAWNISRESFYHWGLVPQLKFRLTYGVSGTVDQHKSAVTVLYLNSAQPPSNLPFASVSQFSNPSLRWERVHMINAGIDFGLRGNRVSGSIEGYYKKGLDLFGPSALDYTAGLRSDQVTRNIARMKGYGIDATVQTINWQGPLQWTTHWLFSYNESITTDYYFSTGQRFIATNGTVISPVPGKALYGLLSYRFGGLDPATGDPLGYINKLASTDYYALNNVLHPDSLVYSGSSMPKFFGALRNTFSFKGFSLEVNITYRFAYVFRRPTINYGTLFNAGLSHGDYAARWQ